MSGVSIRRILACIGVCLGVSSSGAPVEKPAPAQEWIHSTLHLGCASGMELVTEGDSGYYRCVYDKGPWARFNWPRVKAVAGSTSISLKVRRAAGSELPGAIVVRVMTEDGVEWGTPARYPVGDEWKSYTLTGKDFKLFRGGDPNVNTVCDIGKVQQVQFLPITPTSGGGAFEIDDVRILPSGAVYTHDKPEWKQPLNLVQVEYDRLKDLHRLLNVELRRIALTDKQLRDWILILKDAKARWGTERQAVEQLLNRPSNPWLTASSDKGFMSGADVLEPFQSFDSFKELIARFEEKPIVLNDLSDESLISNHVLYQAKEQAKPVVMEEDGVRFVRQRVEFTDEGRQVVFFNFDVPASMRKDKGYLDISKRVIEVKVRCSAKKPFHRVDPFTLRASAEIPGRKESFLDTRAASLPTSEWQVIRFDVASRHRPTLQQLHRVVRLTLRIENRVDVGGEVFDLDVQPMYMEPRSSLGRAVESWLSWRYEVLLKARMGLLKSRLELTALEESLRETPELRQCYLSSFYRGLAITDKVKVLERHPLTEAERSYGLLQPTVFKTRNAILEDGSQRVTVTMAVDEQCDADSLVAVLETVSGGEAIAFGRSTEIVNGKLTTQLNVSLPGWVPFSPNVFRLVLIAKKGDRIVASDKREMGFRKADIMQTGLTTLLRQAWNRNRPDWSYFFNGVPSFARTAVNTSLPESIRKCPVETVRLMQDLWVDGQRYYGMTRNQQLWNLMEQYGIGQLASICPSYRGLQSYRDLPKLLTDYELDIPTVNRLLSNASPMMIQVGNEVELVSWGANLPEAFKGSIFQPLDAITEKLRKADMDMAPMMYVRAGAYHFVEPLPHEDVSGINQYTGRYGGLLDEVHRSLAELGAQATLFNRPIAITEWNGPKYSWAGSGIGGVTLRGASYYLEKYWRAIVQTPGIVGSAEFTLNWIFAPFEDLTNQSRADAYRNRPRHSAFGGGTTADHVPYVNADQVVPDECYRTMQGFHSPLYIMLHTPGKIVLQCQDAQSPEVVRIADAMRKVGKVVDVCGLDVTPEAGAHCLVLSSVKRHSGWFREYVQVLPAGSTEPSIQSAVRRDSHEHLVTVLLSEDEASYKRGLVRLVQAAEALVELGEKECEMPRFILLTDQVNRYGMNYYLADQVARGYFYRGDDVQVSLNADMYLDEKGEFRTAWKNLGAVILDVNRELSEAELLVVNKARAAGANLVLSRKFAEANPGLVNVRFEAIGTFAQELTLVNGLAPERNRLPLKWLGGAELERVKRFRPGLESHSGVNVYRIIGEGGTPLAVDGKGNAVILDLGKVSGASGRTIVLGYDLGDVVYVQRRTTMSGETHRLYDRDTASGLERPARAAVNCAMLDRKSVRLTVERPARWLTLQYLPQSMLVRNGETPRLRIVVRDSQGRIPQDVQLNGRARLSVDGSGQNVTPYFRLKAVEPGVYDIELKGDIGPIAANHGNEHSVLPYYPFHSKHKISKLLTIQFKAYGTDVIPEDGAFTFILE